MNVERFQNVIARLRLIPPQKFDANNWISCQGDLPSCNLTDALRDECCGTAGCVLGWCCVWYPEWTFDDYVPVWGGLEVYDAAAKFFDISIRDALMLFGYDNYRNGVTPGEVADRLEEYVLDHIHYNY